MGLAGCTRQDRVTVRGNTVGVKLSEFRLSPTTTYASPGVLRLVAHNGGVLAHDVSVVQGAWVLARTTMIRPGSTAAISLKLGPGTYRLLSTVSNDETLGLYGFLVVS